MSTDNVLNRMKQDIGYPIIPSSPAVSDAVSFSEGRFLQQQPLFEEGQWRVVTVDITEEVAKALEPYLREEPK